MANKEYRYGVPSELLPGKILKGKTLIINELYDTTEDAENGVIGTNNKHQQDETFKEGFR